MRFMSERDYLATRWPLHQDTEKDWRHGRLRRGAVHNAWAQWLGHLSWELFITLTFDPKKVFPVGQDRASREAVRWCNDTSRAYRRPLGWVVAPERGTSGQWHGHALMIGVPMARGELSRLSEALGMWEARNGSIRVDPVDRVSGITLYTTKQAAAAGTIVLSDTMHRYRPALAADIVVSLCPVESETATGAPRRSLSGPGASEARQEIRNSAREAR